MVMKKTALFAGIIVALYLLVLIAAFLFQNKLLFFPVKLTPGYAYKLSNQDKEVFLKTSDEENVSGILFHRPGNQKVILYFHGNAGALDTWQNTGDDILPLHCDLFIIDYRGYGKSTGTFSEEGFYKDALAAYQFLIQSGYQPNQIIVYGRSLGTGIAMQLAVTQKTGALILESPYCSLPALAAEKMPYLLPQLLLRYKLNTLKRAAELKVPALVIHGKDDDLIPVEQGIQVFNAVTTPKKLLLIEGGGHNDLDRFPQHFDGIKDFLLTLN